MALDLMHHIRVESARFAEVLATTDPTARVPSCPDWNALDLAWHLAEVHHIWAAVVGQRLDNPDAAEASTPSRPDTMPDVLAVYEQTTDAMLDALGQADDNEAVWTWWEPEQTVRFVRRFQAHEALMHRVDAELTAGIATSLPADLAADGVSVALAYARSWRPDDAAWQATGGIGRLRATDTGDQWTFALGAWAGVNPWSGEHQRNVASIEIRDVGEPTFTVSGTAEALDAWQWCRTGYGQVSCEGDEAHRAQFDALTAAGIP